MMHGLPSPTDSSKSSSVSETMSDPHHQTLVDGMLQLMNNEKYCDLVIKCEGREWKVHKALLCSFSNVFDRACKWVTLDGKKTEIIEHEVYDAATMQRLISYVYKGRYKVGEDDIEERDHEDMIAKRKLIAHAKVYGIADYYDIAPLKTFAADRFRTIATSTERLDGFVEVISEVCSCSTPSDLQLRPILSEHILKHAVEFVNDNDFMRGFAHLSNAHELTIGLFREMVVQHVEVKRELTQHLSAMGSELQTLQGALENERTQTASAWSCWNDLKAAMRAVPEKCRNPLCIAKFGGLNVRKSRHTDWKISCTRCSWELVP